MLKLVSRKKKLSLWERLSWKPDGFCNSE